MTELVEGCGAGFGEGRGSGGGREGDCHGDEAVRSIASGGGATRCRTGFGGKGGDLGADASGGTASRAAAVSLIPLSLRRQGWGVVKRGEIVACQNLTLPTLPPGGGGGAHPAGGRRLAVRRVLEERPREALVGEADVEQDDPELLLDEYALDGEPDEELLLGEALHASERALRRCHGRRHRGREE